MKSPVEQRRTGELVSIYRSLMATGDNGTAFGRRILAELTKRDQGELVDPDTREGGR